MCSIVSHFQYILNALVMYRKYIIYAAYDAILRPLSVRWHCLVNGLHTEALVTLKLIFLF